MHSSSGEACGAWLSRFVPRPHASARLFCFAHAGGGAASFRGWIPQLPEHVEVCPIQLPGRANRWGEPPLASIPAMIDALAPALAPLLDRPFVVFGHSMGSMLAYAWTHHLAQRGGPLPAHLFVSGRRPPRMPDPKPPLHTLSDEGFVAEIMRRYGGIPPEVLREPELMSMLLPCLRADILALETYHPGPAAPLPCPVTALGGADDALAPLAHLEAWRDETRAAFHVRQLPGGHFYLDGARDDVLREIMTAVAAACHSQAAVGAAG